MTNAMVHHHHIKGISNVMLTPEQIQQASSLIANARQTNMIIDQIPEDIRPGTLEDAYAIQNRVAELLDWHPTGWFSACMNTEIQQQLGLDEPYYGHAVTAHQQASPAKLRLSDYPPISLECEFAFRLKKDLPPRTGPYTIAEVSDAISSVHPVIEAVASHLKDWITQDVYSVIADNGADGPIIYGPGLSDFSKIDLSKIPVTLIVNGRVQETGKGSNVGGGPLKALTWLVNARSKAGTGMRAGLLNNTGTSTSLYWASKGDEVVANFGELGIVRLSIE